MQQGNLVHLYDLWHNLCTIFHTLSLILSFLCSIVTYFVKHVLKFKHPPLLDKR